MLQVKSGELSLRIDIVDHANPLYGSAARLAQQIYQENYRATICPRPSRFIVCIDENRDAVVACAGVTFGGSGKLFSEHYLDTPLGTVLRGIFGSDVPPSRVCEIGSLATQKRSAGAELVRVIPFLCWFMGQRALICTVTSKLRQLIKYQKWPLTPIASGSIARVPRIEGVDWGTYYDTAPETIVVPLDRIGHLFDSYCSRYSFIEQSAAAPLELVAS